MTNENKPEQERKLYKIGYLTKRLGVTPRTVRYYDQVGLLPHVKRSDGNVRLFDEEDVEIIKKIRKMQKSDYLPLDVIKDRLFGSQGQSENDKIMVLTDSTAVIPSDLTKELNIDIIPLKISMAGKIYTDDNKLSQKEFWKKLDKGKADLAAIAPTVEEFSEKFLALKKQGIEKVYTIHMSGELSKTYANAKVAAEMVSDQIEVVAIDSKSTGAGLGLFVLQVAEALNDGEPKKKIDILIAKQIPLIYYTTMANNLKYLSNMGKENTETEQPQLMQKLYQFKPIFTLKGTGEIEIVDCVSNYDSAHSLLLEHLEQEVQARGKYAKYITITYNYLYGEAVELSNQIREICPNTPVYLEEGCVALTTYLGPETLSISII